MFPLKTTIHVGKYTIHGWYVHNWNIYPQLSPFHWASNPSFSLTYKVPWIFEHAMCGEYQLMIRMKTNSVRSLVSSYLSNTTHWSPVFALTLQKNTSFVIKSRVFGIMIFSHVGIPMDPLLWKRIPTYHITLSNISFSMSALDFVCCSHCSYELQLPSGVLLASPAAVAFGAGDMYRTSFPGRGKMMFLVMSLGKGRSFGKVWFGKQDNGASNAKFMVEME